eukprot:GEMP01001345.1.p1 GENE.GEMP01001345.1~~GEMP01001345.1.p1  ORF type:complete len:1274 (+),score=272.34 GEMP01001345.1:144-3965(+)
MEGCFLGHCTTPQRLGYRKAATASPASPRRPFSFRYQVLMIQTPQQVMMRSAKNLWGRRSGRKRLVAASGLRCISAFEHPTLRLWLGLPTTSDLSGLADPTPDALFDISLEMATSLQHAKVSFTFARVSKRDSKRFSMMTLGDDVPMSKFVNTALESPSMKLFQHYDKMIQALHRDHEVISHELNTDLERMHLLGIRRETSTDRIVCAFTDEKMKHLVSTVLRGWNRFVNDKLQQAQNERINLQVLGERSAHQNKVSCLQMMHLQHVDKAVAYMITQPAFTKWCEAVQESKRDRKVSALEEANGRLRRQAAQKLKKCLMLMDDASASFQCNLAFKAWVEVFLDLKEERRRATLQEKIQRMASLLERQRRKYALQMVGSNVEALKTGCFTTWREYTADAKMDKMTGASSSLQEEVRRLRALHQDHIQKTLAMLLGDSNTALLHMSFSKWRELVEKDREFRRLQAREVANEELRERVQRLQHLHQDHIRKALLAFCSNVDSAFLNSIFYGWRDLTNIERGSRHLQAMKEANEKLRERASKNIMQSFMVRINTFSAFLQHHLFRSWADLAKEKKCVARALPFLASASSNFLRHRLFHTWVAYVTDTKTQRVHLGELHKLHIFNLRFERQRKLLCQFFDQRTILNVLACFTGWQEITSRARINYLRERTSKLEDKVQSTTSRHKARAVASIMLRSSSSDTKVLRVTFAAWATVNQFIRLAQQRLSDEIQLAMSRARLEKSAVVEKALVAFAPSMDPHFVLRKIVREWRHVTIEETFQTHLTAQCLLKARCAQHGRRCAEKLAAKCSTTLVHASFCSWARTVHGEVTEERMNSILAMMRARFAFAKERFRNREVLYRWAQAAEKSRKERQVNVVVEQSRRTFSIALSSIEQGRNKVLCSKAFRVWVEDTMAGRMISFRKENVRLVQNHTRRFMAYSDVLLISTALILWRQQVRLDKWNTKTERSEEELHAMLRHSHELVREQVIEGMAASTERIKQLEWINRTSDERQNGIHEERKTLQETQQKEREAHLEHERTLSEQIQLVESLREHEKRARESDRQLHMEAIRETERQKEQADELLTKARCDWEDQEKMHAKEVDHLQKQLHECEEKIIMLNMQAETLPRSHYLVQLFRVLVEHRWGTVEKAFQEAIAVHKSKYLSKHVFAIMLSQLGINDHRLGDAIWNCMDRDRNGCISFKDFACLELNLFSHTPRSAPVSLVAPLSSRTSKFLKSESSRNLSPAGSRAAFPNSSRSGGGSSVMLTTHFKMTSPESATTKTPR